MEYNFKHMKIYIELQRRNKKISISKQFSLNINITKTINDTRKEEFLFGTVYENERPFLLLFNAISFPSLNADCAMDAFIDLVSHAFWLSINVFKRSWMDCCTNRLIA